MAKATVTAKFKKGMMVRVAPELDWRGSEKTHWKTGDTICNRIWRDRTDEDHAAWRASDASKGIDSAGESKLDSPSRGRIPEAGETFKIVRARVTARSGWSSIPKCSEIVDTDGVHWFVKRAHLH